MTELLFDIESTGLLRVGSTIHCIVMRDMDTVEEAQVFDYKPERAVIQGVKKLEKADVLIGHNIINYDIPLLKEQFPDFTFRGQMLDTLVLSRLFIPILLTVILKDALKVCRKACTDDIVSKPGDIDLKCFKGDFGKHEAAWDKYTPEMLDYCIQDTMVTVKLYELLKRRMNENS